MDYPILKRKRINTQLNNIFDYPLTVIVAAMGYGKTTSVRSFLDEAKAKYLWFCMESDKVSVQYIWESFTRQLARTAPELGNRLNTLGFPADAPQRDRVIGIIADYVYVTKTILVMDDYHFADSPELNRLVERIVRADISGLHIILISRARPDMNIEELKLKGYCFLMKNDLFELSKEEIKEYFKLFGQNISMTTAQTVLQISEGWITAVYLIIQRYREIGRLEQDRNIDNLIETAIMSHYTPAEVRVLLCLCVLDAFTAQQASYVADDAAAAEIIHRLSSDNSLIRYDEQTGTYKIHNIFCNYLRKLLETGTGGVHIRKLYRRSGKWHIDCGDILSGLKAFLKAEEYDLILTEFEKPGITKIVDRYPRLLVELFKQIPTAFKYRHPIGYLTYADFYLTDIDMEGGAELLEQIEQYYREDSAVLPELKRRIFGEIQLSRSFLFFNDIQKMHEYQLKAYQLLDGSSVIANKDMMFTFGSPHTLYLYHREKGEMKWLVDYAGQVFHYYRELSHGCGTGFEYLIKAEYYLETGDFVQAGIYAHKAVYKAETMDQFSIIICAKLTLARLYVAQGKFAEAMELMNDLSLEGVEYNSPILNSAVDLCSGYIGGILTEPQSFAGWLKSGDMQQSELLYQGMAFNYIVYGKSLLLEGNYLKIEVLCEEMQQLFSMFHNLFGYLHAHILDAIVQYKLYGLEKAKLAMVAALDIGRADQIVLPFAEYGVYLLDILETLKSDSGNDSYLNRLVMEAAHYCDNLKRFNDEKTIPLPLTEREREILRLLVEGQTNREIAAGLYIAEITVRKNITSIYRKLEVDGRAAAVKKAVELKLT